MAKSFSRSMYKKKPNFRGMMIDNIGRKIDKDNQVKMNVEMKKLFKEIGLD